MRKNVTLTACVAAIDRIHFVSSDTDSTANWGTADEPDLIYFKLYKSQIPVVEQALEIAARMLGSDRSRGYCLEMICADFLAGAGLHLKNEQEILFLGLRRYFTCCPLNNRGNFWPD